MNLQELTDPQKQALIDLAVLAMYADGHLAAAEDERVHRVLDAIGFTSGYDHGKHYDASVSRVSRHCHNEAAARQYAAALARNFSEPEQRRQVQEILNGLVTSDSTVSSKECNFLSAVRQALQE